MINNAAKAWLAEECASDGIGEPAEQRDYSYADMMDAFVAGAVSRREPTDQMLDQGMIYLPGVDRDALRAAWRIMVDMAVR